MVVIAATLTQFGLPVEGIALILGIDQFLVSGELRDLIGFEKIEFGDADAVLAGDHSAQILRQAHDAFDSAISLLQHLVIVRIHRNVGMHVTVPGVHVQCDEHAALQHVLVHGVALIQYQLISAAIEDLPQRFAYL